MIKICIGFKPLADDPKFPTRPHDITQFVPSSENNFEDWEYCKSHPELYEPIYINEMMTAC
jgi:hypothetical protein